MKIYVLRHRRLFAVTLHGVGYNQLKLYLNNKIPTSIFPWAYISQVDIGKIFYFRYVGLKEAKDTSVDML